MTTYVFAGPSVPTALRASYAPRFQFRPPIQAGELLRLRCQPGDRVVILDGFFRQCRAVQHKEILALLADRVSVYGAASMGALRAAELTDFGMIGSGRVFDDYRRGAIVADDEVALLYGSPEEDYIPYTQALVNIRYALQEAASAGTLSAEQASSALAATQSLPFTDRTAQAILTRAKERGLTASSLAAAGPLLHHAPDVKREDALNLLDRLSRDPETPPNNPPTWHFHETVYVRQWRQSATVTKEPYDRGTLTRQQVHSACRILARDYPAFRTRVAAEALAYEHASTIRVMTGNAASQAERRPPDRTALARHLRVHYAAPSGESDTAVLHRAALDRLRHLGLLGPHAQGNPGFDSWCTRREKELPEGIRTVTAASRALFSEQKLLFSDPFIETLQALQVYRHAKARVVVCAQFNQRIQSVHPKLRIGRISRARIGEWLMKRWECEDLQDIALERGFSCEDDLISEAAFFFLYERSQKHTPPLIISSAATGQPGEGPVA